MRIGTSLAVVILSTHAALAAIPAAMNWDVRTGGSDLNGCGFYLVPGTGTNYAMQNAAQVTFNGGAVDMTTGGAGATATIVGHTVVAGDVNNTVKIASGTNITAGTYHIASVNTGANTWTFDRNFATGAASAVVGRMGGSCASWIGPVNGANAGWTNGDKHIVNIQSGTYTITSTYLVQNISYAVFRGYQTTWGDGGTAPTLTSATNSVPLLTIDQIEYWLIENVNFTHTAGTRGNCVLNNVGSGDRQLFFRDVVFDGCLNGLATSGPQYMQIALIDSTIKNSTSRGISVIGSVSLINSIVKDNAGWGVFVQGPTFASFTVYCSRSAITGNGTGVGGTGGMFLDPVLGYLTYHSNSCAYLENTGDGFSTTGTAWMVFVNNVLYGNSGYGFSSTSGVNQYQNLNYIRYNNAFGDNTLGNYNSNVITTGTNDITLTSNPFTDYTTDNYTPTATAGGGAALTGAGWPTTSILGTNSGINVGPVQTGGAAGTGFFPARTFTGY